MAIAAGLIFLEIIVGRILKKDYYQREDFFCNLGVGLVFILVSIFQFGYNSVLYKLMLDNLSFFTWNQENLLSKVLALIVWEFCYYWMHRSFHTIPFMWAGHAAHHSSNELNFTTTLRRSSTTWIYHPIFFAPMALMGFSWTSFNIAASFSVAWGFCTHTRLIPNLGFLETIFVGPSSHRVHHGKNDPYLDKNHGSVLIIWDRLFNTFQKELKEVPIVYGVREEKPSYNPFKVNFLPYLSKKSSKPKLLKLNYSLFYYALQITALIYSTLLLQINLGNQPIMSLVPAILLGFSLYNLGEMLDGKFKAIWVEYLKFALIIAFFVAKGISGKEAYALALYIGLSISILSYWIRPSRQRV